MAAILVAALVLAVAQSDSRVVARVKTELCQITTLGEGDCGEVGTTAAAPVDEVPTYRDSRLTPLQRALAGQYDTLGDSFSSGEGGSEYLEGTDVNREAQEAYYWATHDENGNPKVHLPWWPHVDVDPFSNTCHRSTLAYAQRLNSTLDFAGGYTFAACSGAVTADFTRPNGQNPDNPVSGNDGEIPQLDNLDDKTSLVTFSISGNDAGFGMTLAGCLLAGLSPLDSCSDDPNEVAAVEANIDQAMKNLETLLPQVRERAPNARILVVGYPRFFPPERLTSWGDDTLIDSADLTFINDKVKEVDDRIAGLVEQQGGSGDGFEYVDAYDAFDGCEIGTDPPCMNNVEVRFSNGNIDVAGSYHPNDRGQERLAQLVEKQLTKGE